MVWFELETIFKNELQRALALTTTHKHHKRRFRFKVEKYCSNKWFDKYQISIKQKLEVLVRVMELSCQYVKGSLSFWGSNM